MGQTNINVSEHGCSRCGRRFAIQSFPYPREVWWCSNCWREFRIKQNEQRRGRRHSALRQYIFRPRPQGGWSAQRPYRSKGGLAALSPHERYLARHEFSRLVDDWKRRGHTLTPKKRASLVANAVFIVKYVRTGKVRAWRGNYHKRLKLWERLQEEQQLKELNSRPIWERHGFTRASAVSLYGVR